MHGSDLLLFLMALSEGECLNHNTLALQISL